MNEIKKLFHMIKNTHSTIFTYCISLFIFIAIIIVNFEIALLSLFIFSIAYLLFYIVGLFKIILLNTLCKILLLIVL